MMGMTIEWQSFIFWKKNPVLALYRVSTGFFFSESNGNGMILEWRDGAEEKNQGRRPCFKISRHSWSFSPAEVIPWMIENDGMGRDGGIPLVWNPVLVILSSSSHPRMTPGCWDGQGWERSESALIFFLVPSRHSSVIPSQKKRSLYSRLSF